MQRFSIPKILSFALVYLLMQGCVNLKPRENATRFYVLSTPGAAQSEAPAVRNEGLIIGLRRLRLAEYLDTPRIVVRVGANEVRFSDTHRWGEDLSPAINRVVAGLLTAKPAIQHVDIVPWTLGVRHDYVFEIEINKFEGTKAASSPTQNMQAHLEARWKIVDPATSAILKQGTTDETFEGNARLGYESLVLGLEQVLEKLSEDLVAAVEAL